MVPRIIPEATSDLKDFHGSDQDEDRARSWVTTVKIAFKSDQAPDDEKCFVFGGLLTEKAQNWYRQLGH
uniref:Retrotransposon gag domain-containing protein n=1 Tax=Peronospora matthiolae TaxID=2874970 RepID=A0AAV1UVL7_9STRA